MDTHQITRLVRPLSGCHVKFGCVPVCLAGTAPSLTTASPDGVTVGRRGASRLPALVRHRLARSGPVLFVGRSSGKHQPDTTAPCGAVLGGGELPSSRVQNAVHALIWPSSTSSGYVRVIGRQKRPGFLTYWHISGPVYYRIRQRLPLLRACEWPESSWPPPHYQKDPPITGLYFLPLGLTSLGGIRTFRTVHITSISRQAMRWGNLVYKVFWILPTVPDLLASGRVATVSK